MNYKQFVSVNAGIRCDAETHKQAKALYHKYGAKHLYEYKNIMLAERSRGELSAEDYDFYDEILQRLDRLKSAYVPVNTSGGNWESLGNGCHRKKTLLGRN